MKGLAISNLLFCSQQNTWACSNGGSRCTLQMSYVFYLMSMCQKNQIAFIFLSFHNVLPPTTSSTTHWSLASCGYVRHTSPQVRSGDVHLVAKIGDELKMKFLHTPPKPLILGVATFYLLVLTLIMCTHCPTVHPHPKKN